MFTPTDDKRKPLGHAMGIAALAAVLVLTASACRTSAPEPAPLPPEPLQVDGLALRYVGTPDRRLMNTDAAVLNPEAGVDATVLQTTHNLGVGLAALIHLRTGEVTYLRMPDTNGTWTVRARPDGGAYLGSHETGYLFAYTPGDTTLRRIDLPRPEAESYDWIFGLDTASDGRVYLGSYPEGALLRYDPATDAVDELGVLLPEAGEVQYVRSVTGQFPGQLFLGMGARAQVVRYDLATGEKTAFLPEPYTDQAFAYWVGRVQDWLAVGISPESAILLFDPETLALERTIDVPGNGVLWQHNRHSLLTRGDQLYFATHGNDALWAHDLSTETTRPVGRGLGMPLGLAQDRYLFLRDYLGTFRVMDLTTEEVVLERSVRLQGAGMQIHTLNPGPDGTLAGGIYINQGFFHYDPAADTLFAPGGSAPFGGQVDHIAAHDGRLYLGHYTKARLSVYDPERPWAPGFGAEANPRQLGRAGDDQDRFPAALAASDARLYFGSIPGYGLLGGALVVVDPATDAITTHRNVVDQQSVYALVEADGQVVGATAVMGGLGATPTADEGKLFAWDPATQTKRWERTVVPGARELWGLGVLPDGRLIGSADSTLYVYDLGAERVVAERAAAVPEIITRLVVSRDGWVYGLTEERFFRVSPDLATLQTLDVHDDYWDSLAETSDGRLFVARGARLYEVLRPSAP